MRAFCGITVALLASWALATANCIQSAVVEPASSSDATVVDNLDTLHSRAPAPAPVRLLPIVLGTGSLASGFLEPPGLLSITCAFHWSALRPHSIAVRGSMTERGPPRSSLT